MIRFFFLVVILLLSCKNLLSQIYGTPIVSWDFANGIPEDWTEGIVSSTNTAHWEYRGPSTSPGTDVGARGSCSAIAEPIASLTQNNGFIIFDGNYWDDPGSACGGGLGSGLDPAPHTAWLITNSVDFTGHNSCVLSFQQQYRHFQTTTKVFISTDGGISWIEILSNDGIQSPNTEWKSLNISEWAANQPDVRFKFEYAGLYYWWLLDDITVYEPNDHDLILTKVQFTNNQDLDGLPTLTNLEYSQYPLSYPPVLTFKSSILNVGSEAQTGVQLNAVLVKDNDLVIYNQTSLPIVSDVSSATDLSITGTYTPTEGIGTYDAKFYILQDSLDATPENNTDSLSFEITPFTYAKDKGPMEDANTIDSFYDEYKVAYGNFFENKETTRYCHTIQAGLALETATGKAIRGVVYNQSLDTLLGYTVPYEVNFADKNIPGEEKLVYLDFETPFAMAADSIYFMAVEELDSIQPFFMARSGKSFGESSLVRFDNINASFVSTKSFLVRLTILGQNQHPGCTDANAINFEASATVEDGSCDYPGCTNQDADNYDSTANFDDGSCMVGGCTDSTAYNYNPLATYQSVTCIFRGCTAFNALNFDSNANEDDGSCIFLYTDLEVAQTGGCPPFTMQLSNHNDYTPEAVCTFTVNGEIILDACASGFDYTFEESGTYELEYSIAIGNAVADTTLTIDVYVLPDQPILTFDAANQQMVCSNCSGNLCTWYVDGEVLNTSSESTVSTEFDGINQNGFYSVLTSNSDGCSTLSDSLYILQPYLTASTQSGCAPVTVSFNNLTDIVSDMSCTLNTGLSVIDNFSEPIEIEYTSEGNYNAELTCSSPNGSGSFELALTINTSEIPTLSVDSTSMTVICSNASSFSEFIWNVDGIISNGSTSQPLGGDVYQIQAYNSAGCGGSSLLIVNDVSTLAQQSVQLYPNPANFSIQLTNPSALAYRILNGIGQIVAENTNPGTLSIIEVGDWQNGIYHVQWLGSPETKNLHFEVRK